MEHKDEEYNNLQQGYVLYALVIATFLISIYQATQNRYLHSFPTLTFPLCACVSDWYFPHQYRPGCGTIIYMASPYSLETQCNNIQCFSESICDPRHKQPQIQQFPHQVNHINLLESEQFQIYHVKPLYKQQLPYTCPALLFSPSSPPLPGALALRSHTYVALLLGHVYVTL